MQKISHDIIAKGEFDIDQINAILGDESFASTFGRNISRLVQSGDSKVQVLFVGQSLIETPEDMREGIATAHIVPGAATHLYTGRGVSDKVALALSTPAHLEMLRSGESYQAQYPVDMTSPIGLVHVNSRKQVQRLEKWDGKTFIGLVRVIDEDGKSVIVGATDKGVFLAENVEAFYSGDEKVRMGELGDYSRHTPVGLSAFLGESGISLAFTKDNDGPLMIGSLSGTPKTVLESGFALRQSWDPTRREHTSLYAIDTDRRKLVVIDEVNGNYSPSDICSIDVPAFAVVAKWIDQGERLQGLVTPNGLVFNTIKADQRDVVIPLSVLGKSAVQLVDWLN